MAHGQEEREAVIVSSPAGSGFQESPVLPCISVGPARALYVGPGLDLAPHLNVATTIAVALQQPFALRVWSKSGGWSSWHPDVVGVIPSETLHHLQCRGPMAFLYLDPLTDRRPPLSRVELLQGRERLRVCRPRIGLGAAFTDRILPAIDRFKPDILFISAGFDSRIGDPLGQFQLTDEDFVLLTRHLLESARTHCQGRLVSVLEGGYNLAGLASAVTAHVGELRRGH